MFDFPQSAIVPVDSRHRASACVTTVLAALLAASVLAAPCFAQQGGDAVSPAAETKGVQAATKENTTNTKKANGKNATGARTDISDCAGGEVFQTLANTANSAAIIYNSNLVPAGSVVEFGLASSLDPEAHYFAVFLQDKEIPQDEVRHGARARRAGETDDLVVKRLLKAGDTIVSIDVPNEAAGWWTRRNLYIYQCDSTRRPLNVSYLPVYLSPYQLSIWLSVAIVVAAYFLSAKAFARLNDVTLEGLKAWNPIRITAGSDNRGSLSAFQVFFFTILVFAMLAYVLLRTGVLSDLSTTVLELLGIAGIGAAAAKGAESSKTTLDPTNQAWLMNKGWFDKSSTQAATDPSFYDLISSDGSFDVYRFQSLIFTGAVGLALFAGGVFQLASFTVPQNILGILGLSQVVYIAGKLVTSNNATQLNAVITDLRNAEAAYREAAHTTTETQEAKDKAARARAAYLDKAGGAAKLFTDVTGRPVAADKLQAPT
ncbi:hypothetical protein [Bradyrhizobium sp. NC92]|uniref:hypothetical protein n=1 Tax=Bradyrhizobium sp. (strain NC92) TaxID=55395 RepID=UPI0021AA3F80|nr:hypothetical protein [Bradyrhizobium sp. NC92]UWU66490.1 hypothetical protein N2602_24970 [Bradyrhizobium sp. NC92]